MSMMMLLGARRHHLALFIGASAIALVLAMLGDRTTAAQDRYNVQVPGGLAFSEFKGYQDWQVVAISNTEELMAAIVANPVMMEAYRAGAPGNSRPFPDGSKIAKIHWKPTKSTEAPSPTTIPGVLDDVDFIVRDSKRFPATGGWGYAQFNYDGISDTFKPEGTGSACGYACHTIVASKDYIFTAYPKR
jgi:Cytochrome P460